MRIAAIALVLAGMLGASSVQADSNREPNLDSQVISNFDGGDLDTIVTSSEESNHRSAKQLYDDARFQIGLGNCDTAKQKLARARRAASSLSSEEIRFEEDRVVDSAYQEAVRRVAFADDFDIALCLFYEAQDIATRYKIDTRRNDRWLMDQAYRETRYLIGSGKETAARKTLGLARGIAIHYKIDTDREEKWVMDGAYDEARSQIGLGQCNSAKDALAFASYINRKLKADVSAQEKRVRDTAREEAKYQRSYGNHDKAICFLRL